MSNYRLVLFDGHGRVKCELMITAEAPRHALRLAQPRAAKFHAAELWLREAVMGRYLAGRGWQLTGDMAGPDEQARPQAGQGAEAGREVLVPA